MRGPEPSARAVALEAVRRVDAGTGFLRDELHALLRQGTLSPRDRALATQLAAGIVRHRRTLRLVVSHVRGEGRRAGAIQPDLLGILELGAFQLLFLDRVPAYAAVNEAVAQARGAARGPRGNKTAGFVNAVLRGIQRLVVGREAGAAPARDALPHPEGGIVRLAHAVLPDPDDSRVAFLGAAYSYPDWLVARWLDAFGDEAEALCRWGNRRPRTLARVNRMCHDPAELLARLQAETPQVAPGPRTGTLDVSSLDAARLAALADAGDLTVQDPSAMAAVEALAPQPGETVLDLCASPGTKTTQIVEAMGDTGRVVACDRSDEKLRPLRETAAARHLASVRVCLSSDAQAELAGAAVDAALVDAPCSNTGVLARRVEARWRLRAEDLAELPRLQAGLLEQAAAHVRPGGRVVYSTCSLQREENEGVVSGFLARHEGWQLARQELILPGAEHDGAFWALFTRSDQGGE